MRVDRLRLIEVRTPTAALKHDFSMIYQCEADPRLRRSFIALATNAFMAATRCPSSGCGGRPGEGFFWLVDWGARSERPHPVALLIPAETLKNERCQTPKADDLTVFNRELNWQPTS